MNARPRAVHLAPILPSRSGNGLAMRQGLFLEALSRVFETHLVVLPVAGSADASRALADQLGVPTTVIPVAGRQDTLFTLLSRVADPASRLDAFRRYGRSSLAAHLSAAVLRELGAALTSLQPDFIHIGRSYLADALSVISPSCRVSLDLDEDEWASFREQAAVQRSAAPERAAWLEAEADALAARIEKSAFRVDRHFIASTWEAEHLARRMPVFEAETVENAVAIPDSQRREDDGATVLFLGSFGYAPNVDAATWLVEAIWPKIRRKAGGPVRLQLAGNGSDRLETLRGRSGVELVGSVVDVADAYAAASVVVAPLRSGAGTRLKLIEAAAHGVPIVSTALGARGLAFMPQRDLVIADTAEALADAVVACLRDPAAARARAGSAHALAREHYDREPAIARLACRLSGIVAR